MSQLFASNNIFMLQWHITVRCQMRCQHCYIYDKETYANELKNELDFNTCLRVMDDFVHMCKMLKVRPSIHFTGGDPFLRDDFFELMKEARQRDIEIGILGNSFMLDDNNVKRLLDLNISLYQLSLDGMENIHDMLRQRGSFKDIIRAIKLLKRNNIRTMISMTLSKLNSQDIFPLMDCVGELGVDIFTYARFCPTGEGKNKKEWLFTAEEYRDFVKLVNKKIEEKKEENCSTLYGKKCYLLSTLLAYEEGRLKLPPQDNKIYFGCSLGIHGLILLANGEVHACRRFYSRVGSIKEEKLLDIFINSPQINEYRNVELLQKCSKCELLQVCRGCPAVSNAVYGDWTAPDPQCWKSIT